MTSQEPRERLMQAIRKLSRRGILDASSGNISLRTDDQRIFVTPSGIDYDDMEPSDLVEIALSDAVNRRQLSSVERMAIAPRNLQGARGCRDGHS